MTENEFFDIQEPDMNNIRVLYTEEEIRKRTLEMAEEIEEYFPSDEPLYIICVLKGGMMFCADLIKCLKKPIQLEFVKVSSYGNEIHSNGEIKIIGSIPNIDDLNVLLVDDAADTGQTLRYLTDVFNAKYSPKCLKTAVLINKKDNRQMYFEPDFYGFLAYEKWLVGYGLDYVGFYRNLPFVGCFGGIQ